MTKDEIVKKVAKKTELLTEKQIEQVLNAAIETIIGRVSKGETIYLRGFGTFSPKYRASKKGRNIAKGTLIDIPAHYIPFFKPGKEFKKSVKTLITNK